MNKISAVYKIVNTVTKDCYVGSSKNVYNRWRYHKSPSSWKKHSNSQLYKDIQKYGIENFRFQILAPVEPEYLRGVEQEFIEMLHPTYNDRRSKGFDVERHQESLKKYNQSESYKEAKNKYMKKYYQSDKGKEYHNTYRNQLCSYMGETLTLNTLAHRFYRAGVKHPFPEAKKYLLH